MPERIIYDLWTYLRVDYITVSKYRVCRVMLFLIGNFTLPGDSKGRRQAFSLVDYKGHHRRGGHQRS